MSTPGSTCPVCAEHSEEERLESCLLTLNGAEAILKGDSATVKDIFQIITPYDGHTAITLYASMLLDMCEAFGADAEMTLDVNKQRVREALREQQAGNHG